MALCHWKKTEIHPVILLCLIVQACFIVRMLGQKQSECELTQFVCDPMAVTQADARPCVELTRSRIWLASHAWLCFFCFVLPLVFLSCSYIRHSAIPLSASPCVVPPAGHLPTPSVGLIHQLVFRTRTLSHGVSQNIFRAHSHAPVAVHPTHLAPLNAGTPALGQQALLLLEVPQLAGVHLLQKQL